MTGVRIRHAVPGDAAGLVALARAVAAEPEGWLLAVDHWRSVAEERRYLRAACAVDGAAVLVAEAPGGGLVGRLSLARDTHPASTHVADLGIMVALAWRGRGVGRALMEAAIAWARTEGIAKLELHVFPHNGPAIGLYERLGFVQEGYRRAHYERGGERSDVVLMALHLAD